MTIEKYPFIIPLLIIWAVFFIAIVLVFYTKLGLRNWPILNRKFLMRSTALVLLLSFLGIFGSGIAQIFGIGIGAEVAGQPFVYWHAMMGYIFLLVASLHLTYHIKDIYRYIFKNRSKRPDDHKEPDIRND